MTESTVPIRLCPHCANSIALDAVTCPYCKASLDAAREPQWPSPPAQAVVAVRPERGRKGLLWALIPLALLALAGGGYLVMGQLDGAKQTELLAAKDRAVRESAEKVKALEAELARSREELKSSAAQIAEFKSKFSEQDKLLVEAYNRIKGMSRDADRPANRASAAPPPARPRDPVPPAPAVTPAPPSAPRRAGELGVYETVRATSVHEEPLAGSRVVSRIAGGTQITVVRVAGEWLEVRSKQGNPPGFVRADDAMLISRAN